MSDPSPIVLCVEPSDRDWPALRRACGEQVDVRRAKTATDALAQLGELKGALTAVVSELKLDGPLDGLGLARQVGPGGPPIIFVSRHARAYRHADIVAVKPEAFVDKQSPDWQLGLVIARLIAERRQGRR